MSDPVRHDPADAPPEPSEPAAAAQPDGADPEAAGALAALQRERDEFRDRWMRTAAEFENYRKRVDRERREQADQAVLELLRELLLVVDDFERALAAGGEGGEAYRKGVELIYGKLHELLRKQGVEPIEALGADFDPNLHQAVVHEETAAHRDAEVIAELRRGYTIHGRLLRPAMVKVAKA
jgi:molecular chaperone GrpE